MTSDSAIPNKEPNSTNFQGELSSTTSDVEVNSTVSNLESNSANSEAEGDAIIPETELNSVLLYLKSNEATAEVEANPASANLQLNTTPANVELNSAIANLQPGALLTEVTTISSLLDINDPIEIKGDNKQSNNIQVKLKTDAGRLLIILPTESEVPASELTWSDIWQQLKLRLKAGDRFRMPNTIVHLIAQDRLLDGRQLQELAETLNDVQLHLKCIATSRRQTAIAAVTSGYSVEQLQPETTLKSESKTTSSALADALYLEMTVRSGVEIRHPGSVIILGDINPGGIVVAEGDILVWGRLRGIAHAGVLGNRECLIMALQMEPTQLRIADVVARAPEKLPTQFVPEVAHITPQGIRIAKANDFSRSQLTRTTQVP